MLKLRQIGSRLTESRKSILSILESATKPVTVKHIVKCDPSLVQSSLYRNLTVLEQANLVTRLVNENDFAFFELDEHVLGHHHHIRCLKCGEVSDVELEDKIETLLELTTKKIARKYKFIDVEHHLDFTGVCKNCNNR